MEWDAVRGCGRAWDIVGWFGIVGDQIGWSRLRYGGDMVWSGVGLWGGMGWDVIEWG